MSINEVTTVHVYKDTYMYNNTVQNPYSVLFLLIFLKAAIPKIRHPTQKRPRQRPCHAHNKRLKQTHPQITHPTPRNAHRSVGSRRTAKTQHHTREKSRPQATTHAGTPARLPDADTAPYVLRPALTNLCRSLSSPACPNRSFLVSSPAKGAAAAAVAAPPRRPT